MNNGQEQWDRLVNMPQSYEVDPSIAQRAMEEIEQRQIQPKKNWLLRYWKAVLTSGVAVVMAVLVVCIGIPLYNKLSAPQIVYYATNDITYEDVENPTVFIEENGINVLYFNEAAMLTSKVAMISETKEFAFLEQNTLHINDEGYFDKVDFWGVAKENAEFNFYKDYTLLSDTYMIGDISVLYQLIEMPTSGNRQVLAKFAYENGTYFLDIVTEQDGLQQLEVYVNMLLG